MDEVGQAVVHAAATRRRPATTREPRSSALDSRAARSGDALAAHLRAERVLASKFELTSLNTGLGVPNVILKHAKV